MTPVILSIRADKSEKFSLVHLLGVEYGQHVGNTTSHHDQHDVSG